jgi:polyhydroxybutyrate depolymerase
MLAPAASAAQRATPALKSGDHTFTVVHDGRRRSYIVHMPRTPRTPAPVVIALHGGGGEASGFAAYAGLDAVSDREGFLVVYPDGTGVLPRRLLTWNAGECCAYAMNQRVDDVGFVMAVLDDVGRRTPTDPRRVYATGHSNGAMMAYRLGAERADRIAAIAPVAGAYNMDAFAPTRPVALLHIHSTDDPRALYEGGIGPPFPGTGVRASHRPVMAGVERFRLHNGCSPQPATPATRAGTAPDGARQTATLLVWARCAAGGDVAHWKLTAVGHGWPGVRRAGARDAIIGPPTTIISAADEIWKFFSRVSR